MRCKYCYEKLPKLPKLMSTDTARTAIRFMINQCQKQNVSTLFVQLHGGEPLLNKSLIWEILKEFSQWKQDDIEIKFSMTTNGTLLDRKIIECLKQYRVETSISIDGNARSHDANRIFPDGTGSFDTVFSNVILAKEIGLPIKARATINTTTVQYLAEMTEYLFALHFNEVLVSIDSYDKNWTDHNFSILEEQLERLISIQLEHNKRKDNIRIPFVRVIESTVKKKRCDGGITSFHVDPDGVIFPCVISVSDPRYSIGSVFFGLDYCKIASIHALNDVEIEECAGCQRYQYCDAIRCRIINEKITGTPHKPPVFTCVMQNILVRINLEYNKQRKNCEISF